MSERGGREFVPDERIRRLAAAQAPSGTAETQIAAPGTLILAAGAARRKAGTRPRTAAAVPPTEGFAPQKAIPNRATAGATPLTAGDTRLLAVKPLEKSRIPLTTFIGSVAYRCAAQVLPACWLWEVLAMIDQAMLQKMMRPMMLVAMSGNKRKSTVTMVDADHSSQAP